MRARIEDLGEDELVDLDSDLALALELADIADSMTLPAFEAGEHSVEYKEDGTPVADTDLAVERALVAHLEDTRPDDAILGEEFGERGRARRRWILDPIDGTTGFVEGRPAWGTQICLEIGQRCVVGVTSAPQLLSRWWGAVGLGAWRRADDDVHPIQVATEHQFSEAVASRHPPGADPTPIGDRMAELFDLYEARPHGVLLVAEGIVDICVQDRGAAWDFGAFAAIVTAAGGRFSYLDGTSTVMGSGPGVFTNGVLHEEVLDALR